MAVTRTPLLVLRTTAAGRRYGYWQPSPRLARAGWKTVPLGPADTDAQEFACITAARAHTDKVREWERGGARPASVRRIVASGTGAQLIQRFRDEHLPRVRASTRREYISKLNIIERWCGKEHVAHITHDAVRTFQDALLRPDKKGIAHPHRAAGTLRVLRTLFVFAERTGFIPRGTSPVYDITIANPKGRRRVWERDEQAAFIAAAIDLNMPSIALAAELAEYTAQRQGDLIALTEGAIDVVHIADPALARRLSAGDAPPRGWHLEQAKTGAALQIVFEPGLLARVDRAIARNRARDRAAGRLVTYVLVDDATGLPFTTDGFIRAWQAALRHAIEATGKTAMADLQFRDWRRTRVVRMRRHGYNREQIASLTGHSLKSIDAMLEVYGPVDATMTAGAIAGMLDAEAKADIVCIQTEQASERTRRKPAKG